MRIDGLGPDGGPAHLTYCTNIHAGETWAEVKTILATHVPAVKARVAAGHPFGVGLRLGALAVSGLKAPIAIISRSDNWRSSRVMTGRDAARASSASRSAPATSRFMSTPPCGAIVSISLLILLLSSATCRENRQV